MRSRTAGVMTTLMRNGRDRRSGKPVKCHAILERVRLFGTRSADYIRASSHNGCIQRPNTWLHPNASLKCQIFPLHRGRRPYMAELGIAAAQGRDGIKELLAIVAQDGGSRLPVDAHAGLIVLAA